MGTAKTKQKIRRRLKGALKGVKTARRMIRGGTNLRSRLGISLTLTRLGRSLSSGSGRALTRRLATRNVLSDRPAARRERANARASANPPSSTQVRKRPVLKRQNARRDLNPTNEKKLSPRGTPKYDIATGRTLFPMEGDGEKILYVPMANEATDLEIQNGAFLPDAAVQKDPVNTLLKQTSPASVRDVGKGRIIFATQNAEGQREYLPRKSEATALELSLGKYVNDEEVQSDAPLGENNAMGDRPPKYDLGKGRKVYPVNTPDGKPLYLPREGDADGAELANGLFIPDDVVAQYESKRRRTALHDNAADVAQRRAQRAATLPAGVNRRTDQEAPIPVRKADDGTELWDGFTPPEVSEEKQHETLKTLKPKYDIGQGRMLYPTETAQGKIEYLPLQDDADDEEEFLGLYAAFVPPEPLENFISYAETHGKLTRQNFSTKRGDVQAFKQEDIEELMEQAPRLVLRSAQLVSDRARLVPELHQQFDSSVSNNDGS